MLTSLSEELRHFLKFTPGKTNHPQVGGLPVTQGSLYRATRTTGEKGSCRVRGSSVNGDYFARTTCATTINQLKVFDIILPITFHWHVYFVLCATIELVAGTFEKEGKRSEPTSEKNERNDGKEFSRDEDFPGNAENFACLS